MENNERSVERQKSPEVMGTPDIAVQEEPGAQALSFILKAHDPEWGDTESAVAKEASSYFAEHPLNEEIVSFLKTSRASEEDRFDEEALYILALTYGHPERTEAALETIAEHKSHIDNPAALQARLRDSLGKFLDAFRSTTLAEKVAAQIKDDMGKRVERIDEVRERIGKLIDFFRPDPETTRTRKITLMPTDPLYGHDSGSGFAYGDELVLKSHIDNPDNLEHEFLHTVINPIVDKLAAVLTDEQKEKISSLASGKLKHEQEYGTGYYSLLCEELIRTYNDVFKYGKAPGTFDDLRNMVDGMDEETFQRHLARSKSLKARCGELGISDVDGFKASLEAYFERYERNELREVVYKLYEEYATRDDATENFESFITRRLPETL